MRELLHIERPVDWLAWVLIVAIAVVVTGVFVAQATADARIF